MNRFNFIHRLRRSALSLARFAGFAAVLLAAATASATDFRDILPGFVSYDYNQDGIDEIESLELMFDDELSESTPSSAELVVVLVEERLLDFIPGSPYSASSLITRLDRLRTDLRVQGYTPKVVVARVYAGEEGDAHYHQDGRTVLALRELLRTTRDSYPKLAGTLLVGDFPEAMVVRSFMWRKNDDRVTVWPQPVARRTDLVLGDLDGNWEDVYHEGPVVLGAFNAGELTPAPDNPAAWPCNGCSVESRSFMAWQETFEDVFYVEDASYGLRIGSPPLVTIDMIDVERGRELASGDHSAANPIAQPEIAVSRINSRHVAIAPDPSWRDLDGKGLLDASGRPQTVRSNQVPKWWHDPALERRLLVEYFDRNHSYRAGNGNRPLRTSAIAYPEEDFSVSSVSTYLQKAATGSFQSPLKVEDGNVLEFVDFLKQPATLKGIHAHSDRVMTQFGDDYDDAALEQAIGGPYIWSWVKQGAYWVPGLGDYGKDVGDELFYTMWRNNKMGSTGGVFYVHLGCDVNSPNEAETSPYNDPTYGRYQNGESHLFFGNGVAMVTRSKDFNDKPEGFTEALDDSIDTPFGAGWLRQFEIAAASSSLGDVDVQRKRSYNWGLLGDWTLALAPPKSETYAVFFDGYSYASTAAKLGLGTYEKGDFPLLPANVDSIAIPAQREVRILNSSNGVGRYITLREDTPDLGRFGYDNWMNSAQVRNRTYEAATLYSEGGYWGNSAVLPPGHYTFSQLRDGFGLNAKTVSSMVLSNVEVFIYDRQTWWNNWRAFGSSVYNLASYGWNDRMESIVVVPKGRYGTVYQHASWSGQHAALEPGRYDKADLQGMGLPTNLEISSVSMGSQIRMKLYRQTGFRGTPLVLEAESVRNLSDLGWNDVVQSIIVELR